MAARGRTNLDVVNECDNFPRFDLDSDAHTTALEGLYTLHVADHHAVLGLVLPHVAETLQGLPAWDVSPESRTLILLAGVTAAERSAVVAQTTAAMRATRHFAVLNRGWRDEPLPVCGNDGELLFTIERAAAPLFGLLTCRVALTCFVRGDSGLRFWVPRRAATARRRAYPGMLDCCVSGCLLAGESPREALAREARARTSLARELVEARARPVGSVSHFLISDERAGGEAGLMQPQAQFVYDLEVSDAVDVTPADGDSELDGFALLSAAEVQAALVRGAFAPGAALVMLDFFVRHGVLTAENEPDYTEIVSRLHRRLRLPGPRIYGPVEPKQRSMSRGF